MKDKLILKTRIIMFQLLRKFCNITKSKY